MTGICGVLFPDKHPDIAGLCTQMRQSLAMFGPHGAGQWDGNQLSLGIQKFHTLPEDIYDHQPLSDARFTMVADIRLHNRPELATEFGWSEAEAARRADADFAFAAWQKWGEASLDKLMGDWALALWDRQTKTLTLARDMMAQQPLFWHKGIDENGMPFFAFSSMTHGLFALPSVKMVPDTETLKYYLALAPMRGDSWFFKDIHRVLPGGVVRISADGSVASHDWYDWSKLKEVPVKDDATCIREFRTIFDRAVKDLLRTTGGIACHLSSGFDSSAVATTAARLLAKEGKRISAYTHVPHKGWQTHVAKGRFADEGPIAGIVAATCPNIDHHLVDSGEKEIGSDISRIFYYAQTPALNLCNCTWGYEIQRLATRNGASLLLGGGMGNMTISQNGLERQRDDFFHGRLISWWHELRAMKAHGFKIRGSLYRTFGHLLPGPVINRLRAWTGQETQKIGDFSTLRRNIYESDAFKAEIKNRAYDPYFRPHPSVREKAEFVMRRLDIRGVMRKTALAYSGLDVRDPTSDRRLLEFSLSLPSRMWLRNGEIKWLYRQAFKDQVPEEVFHQVGHGQQGGDWPERMRRSWQSLKMEVSPTLEDPDVQKLIDTDFYRKMMAAAFPKQMNERLQTRYRIKFLRGLSVATFIRKANMRN